LTENTIKDNNAKKEKEIEIGTKKTEANKNNKGGCCCGH